MARLPNLDDLGPRPTPRAGLKSQLPIASVANPDAISRAVGNFGDQLARTGDQALDREDKLNYAAAKSTVLKADAETRQQLADDPDYGTIEKRYTERMTKARADASAMIASKFDRRLFDADTATDIDRGTFEVRKIATNKKKAADTGLFASTLEDLQASARLAQDDATREAAITTATEAITGAQANGLIDPVKAVEMRRGWTNEYVAGQAMVALDKGDIDKARGIVDRFGKYLSSDSYLKLNAAINNEGDAQAVMTAANAGMGKPIVAAPADVPAAVKRLFPGAEVTSFKRSRIEQDALIASGATAAKDSHHLDGHALDTRPIPGVAFADYVKTLKANGVHVIEALEETGKGKGQGTGAHWHIAWTDTGGAAPDTVEQAVSRSVAALGPNTTAKQIEATRNEVVKRWQLKEASEKDAEDNAVESAQAALIKNGGNWYALPVSVRASVNPKYVPGLINFGEGLAPSAPKRITDPSEYVRLTTMASTNPKAFAAINPVEYRGKFDDGDWGRLVGERAKILGKGDGPGADASATLGDIRAVTRPMLDAHGLTTKGLRTRDTEGRQAVTTRIYNFEKAVNGDVENWMRNNPGKKPQVSDIQAMADRRLLTSWQDGSKLFEFETTPGKRNVIIPTAQVARISRLMRPILGRDPTQQEVLQAYLDEGRAGS